MKKKKTTVRKVTHEKIKKYLDKIGFSMRNHGCECWLIYNSFGKMTGLCVFSNYELRSEFTNGDMLFGGAEEGYIHSGAMSWRLSEINMEYQKGIGNSMVSFLPKGNNHVFISLYDQRNI